MHQLIRPRGGLSRRRFLRTLAGGALASAAAPVLASVGESRSLAFLHTHTGEALSVTYFRGGAYVPDALAQVAKTLRDFRSGEVHDIDPVLLDTLFELQAQTGHDKPWQIISAYRSPATNAKLAAKSSGVATHSMHMLGRAIDVRVSSVPTKRLRDLALAMRRGGVGYYRDSDFLHLDTGRVRSW
jgi:uncharacterized protein YcbK (DUF882 family)